MASSTGATIYHLPMSADARLRLAMRSLDAALEEQREAIAGLRAAFTKLGASVNGLSDGLAAYGSALDQTQRDVARARGEAERLAATAAFMEGFATP